MTEIILKVVIVTHCAYEIKLKPLRMVIVIHCAYEIKLKPCFES